MEWRRGFEEVGWGGDLKRWGEERSINDSPASYLQLLGFVLSAVAIVFSVLFQFHLEPGSEATFRLNISYPNKLGSYLGEVKVHTSFDRQLHIPVQYKTAMGTLHLIPDKITFEPTFPVREWRRGVA